MKTEYTTEELVNDIRIMADSNSDLIYEEREVLRATAERLLELQKENESLRQQLANNATPSQASGWISVKDRLPDHESEVLVYLPDQICFKYAFDAWSMQREAPVSWSTETVETGMMWDEHEFEEISHWMPLPPAPSAEER